jgi:hypothetical protein
MSFHLFPFFSFLMSFLQLLFVAILMRLTQNKVQSGRFLQISLNFILVRVPISLTNSCLHRVVCIKDFILCKLGLLTCDV